MGLEVRKQNLIADLDKIQARIAAGELPERALTDYLGGLTVLEAKLLLVAVEEDMPLREARKQSTARATKPSAMSAAEI